MEADRARRVEEFAEWFGEKHARMVEEFARAAGDDRLDKAQRVARAAAAQQCSRAEVCWAWYSALSGEEQAGGKEQSGGEVQPGGDGKEASKVANRVRRREQRRRQRQRQCLSSSSLPVLSATVETSSQRTLLASLSSAALANLRCYVSSSEQSSATVLH